MYFANLDITGPEDFKNYASPIKDRIKLGTENKIIGDLFIDENNYLVKD